MRKNILKLLLLASLSAVLILGGCSQEKTPEEVSTPEDTAHVTEEAGDEEPTAAEDETKETTEEDAIVYDPDKESLVFEEFKLGLFKGYSTVEAQTFLKENMKYLGVEKADAAILELDKRLKENQNYYINQLMDEDVQNAILLAYNLEDNTFDIEDLEDDTYKPLIEVVLNNGYKFFPEEGLFYPIVDYRSLQVYDRFTSDEIRSYLELLARDSDAPSTSDAHLNIVIDELAARILLAETHLTKFPEGQTFDTIYDAYEMYMQFYTVSMAYMGGFDVETRDISEELLSSYEGFVKDNKETTSAAIISDYLAVLKEHDNKINNDVLDFLQDFNDVIVKHISTVIVK